MIAAAAVGGAAIIAWQATKSRGQAAPAASQSVTASASIAPPPLPPPPPPKESCDVMQARVIARLGTDDAALGDADRDNLYQDARELGRNDDVDGGLEVECRAKVFSALLARKTCGRAEAAVAGGLSVAAIVSPADLRMLVERASPGCAATFAESVGYAANVDAPLARALLARARKDPDEGVRRSAWLAYGSIAEIASRTAKNDVRVEIETTIVAELTKSKGPARLLSVQTAGNAGCRPCLTTLLSLADAPDTELRRNAVAALRFQDDPRATRRTCVALENDAENSVRDLSAWSLGFRTTNAVVRVPCLYRSAMTDKSERVRLSATRALGGLSDDLEPAFAAIIQLSGPDAVPSVREAATRILATEPSQGKREIDEASIAAFLQAAQEDTLLEDASTPRAPR